MAKTLEQWKWERLADPDFAREYVAQLEAENERLREGWSKFKRWAENKAMYENSSMKDEQYEEWLAQERKEAEEYLTPSKQEMTMSKIQASSSGFVGDVELCDAKRRIARLKAEKERLLEIERIAWLVYDSVDPDLVCELGKALKAGVDDVAG